MRCRFCNASINIEFIDLGNSPPSNSFLTKDQLDLPEVFYPLKLMVCHKCFLVQIEEYKSSQKIFSSNYIYYSSFSSTWLEHCRRYVEMIIKRLSLDGSSHVVEIASNDGYMLQYFKEKMIPCLGIEPAVGTARSAREKGIEVICDFFGKDLATALKEQGRRADLLLGNNVLAHVPVINDFISGLKVALKDAGVITMEFPHLMRLVDNCQFDTIYHEHFSYLSFITVCAMFKKHGLEIFDVEELTTHGGSLRIFARHSEDLSREISSNVRRLFDEEISRGMNTTAYYEGFQAKADRIKYDLLNFLLDQKKNGRKVAAYGAAAKGNTLLNYCGVRRDLLSFVVDASPHKQGKHLPGSHIPVWSEDELKRCRPDYVLILPWNIKDEIMAQLDYIRAWGGRFVTPVPGVEII
jgi:hypothetical protein